ncbi:DUF4038 domain-containing protein [Ningiella sp. W23]|uniref:apiosidase-like domain-containing protein n=1 Tax=Ningiella sp. W23 TaxID=3023715 RepID=UPI003756501A
MDSLKKLKKQVLIYGISFSLLSFSLAAMTHAQDSQTISAPTHNAEGTSNADTSDAKPWNNGPLVTKFHMLAHANGEPFFYLGDTAWELFHRLDREEVDVYLSNRAAKGFNVIQAVALAELQGLSEPNAYGHFPLVDNNPLQPDIKPGDNNDYWDHVNYVIERAEHHGLYVAFLPIWGQWVHPKWMEGINAIFTDYDTAYSYGEWIANKYKHHPNIIWVVGGDRVPETDIHTVAFNGMANGINDNDDAHLITFHPQGWGDKSSQHWWHDNPWLDFNMGQTGHSTRDNLNVINMMTIDRNKQPIKPSINAEPAYEDHPVNWKQENGYFRAYDVRQNAYWSVFSGGAGFTYGHHSIWQMYDEGRKNINFADRYWHQALDRPGADDMRHLKSLIMSYPYFSRRPAPEIFEQTDGDLPVVASMGENFVMLYFADSSAIKLKPDAISLSKSKARWFNPRNGAMTEFNADIKGNISPPSALDREMQDYVLVIDL